MFDKVKHIKGSLMGIFEITSFKLTAQRGLIGSKVIKFGNHRRENSRKFYLNFFIPSIESVELALL